MQQSKPPATFLTRPAGQTVPLPQVVDHILDATTRHCGATADLEARLGTALESPNASREQGLFVSAAMDIFRPLAHELLEHLAKRNVSCFPGFARGAVHRRAAPFA